MKSVKILVKPEDQEKIMEVISKIVIPKTSIDPIIGRCASQLSDAIYLVYNPVENGQRVVLEAEHNGALWASTM